MLQARTAKMLVWCWVDMACASRRQTEYPRNAVADHALPHSAMRWALNGREWACACEDGRRDLPGTSIRCKHENKTGIPWGGYHEVLVGRTAVGDRATGLRA